MKLEQQVCSLELAKKLKELGVKQDSYFYWLPGRVEFGYEGEWNVLVGKSWEPEVYSERPDWYQVTLKDYDDERTDEMDEAERKRIVENDVHSAFTVAELGEMLPRDYASWCESKDVWVCKEIAISMPAQAADTEADARAKMLIYLIENGVVDPKQV